MGLYTLGFSAHEQIHLASEPSIYWYDFETTGIDSIVDRPLQVAGIRTDHSLFELDESPINVFCRPGNDVVPNPDALLVTGIKMSDVLRDGLPERKFASRLLDQFSRPNTCVAGFNSLRFDDEFTRQLLYRNFHDPYAREWQNGNSRWDVIDVFRAAYALRPDGLNWPKKPDGTQSFRLEDLARANNLPHMDAHDALADVRATIAVARLLKEAQPKLFNFAFGLRDKRAVLQQLYPLGKAPVVHV
ncbi:MAG: exodeoxyribonuclease-1, partial [Candidatus Azotimanducaceae bacterium]